MEIRRYADAEGFLKRAEAWLLRREAENNLLLGLARQLVSADRSEGRSVYLATAEDAGDVAGCAFRTPPRKLGLTRFPKSAIPLLVEDVGSVFDELPAVFGPAQAATAFADRWTRRFAGAYRIGRRERIYSLESMAPSLPDVLGTFRLAGRKELELAVGWGRSFLQETGVEPIDIAKRTRQLIDSGSLYLWEDGEPRSMAAAAALTPNGARVAYVYTPRQFRRRGYATAVVSSLSRMLLAAGRFCFLYADLANPTSNAIYERIGYRKVCDVVDVDFS